MPNVPGLTENFRLHGMNGKVFASSQIELLFAQWLEHARIQKAFQGWNRDKMRAGERERGEIYPYVHTLMLTLENGFQRIINTLREINFTKKCKLHSIKLKSSKRKAIFIVLACVWASLCVCGYVLCTMSDAVFRIFQANHVIVCHIRWSSMVNARTCQWKVLITAVSLDNGSYTHRCPRTLAPTTLRFIINFIPVSITLMWDLTAAS